MRAVETMPLRTDLETWSGRLSLEKCDVVSIKGANSSEAIQTRSAQWPENVRFRILDIQEDAKSQGFEDLYDVIVASDLELATPDLDKTLAQIRRLLRPGGKLVLMDIIKSTFSATLASCTTSG